MPKRGSEPEEAMGPQLDGLKDLENIDPETLPRLADKDHDPLNIDLPLPLEEDIPEPALLPDEPVVLIFGDSPAARATASLAAQCEFEVEVAWAAEEDMDVNFPESRKTHLVPDYLDIVKICSIDRGFYVCVFASAMEDCEVILSQCLASPATYIGVDLPREDKATLYAMLKEDGAPDAELAAVCCPAGLAIGADTPEETAVAIVAEMLAARAGTLKRLRYED